MGAVFRFIYCRGCGKRHRKPVETCSCGKKDFRYSDWYIRVKVHGRNYEEKVGSKTLARQVLVKREAEIADGKFKIRRAKKILMRDFVLGDYWKLYASKRKSADTFERRIKKHILPEFGHMYLDQIEELDIQRWIDKQDEIYEISTVNRHLALLKSIFKFAKRWKGVSNQTVNVTIRKENNEVVKLLSKEELRLLVNSAPNWYTKAFIVLGIGTLLRKGNLLRLKWEHIDLRNRIMTIPGTITKNSDPVTIPMIDEVYEVICSIPRSLKSEYVLTNPKSGKRFKDIYSSFRKARKTSGISPTFTPHGLRHTGISWLVMAGVPTRTIMALANIKNESVLKRYAHLAPEHLQKQISKISGFLEEDKEEKITSKGGY